MHFAWAVDSFQVFYSKTIKRRTKVPVWQMGSTFVIINLVYNLGTNLKKQNWYYQD